MHLLWIDCCTSIWSSNVLQILLLSQSWRRPLHLKDLRQTPNQSILEWKHNKAINRKKNYFWGGKILPHKNLCWNSLALWWLACSKANNFLKKNDKRDSRDKRQHLTSIMSDGGYCGQFITSSLGLDSKRRGYLFSKVL